MHRITLLITMAVLAALLELAISKTIYMHGIVRKNNALFAIAGHMVFNSLKISLHRVLKWEL